MFVLYEHASGYVLVHCEQTDDISELNANDYASFGQLVKLKAFQPFTSAAIALDNMNAVSEGKIHCKTSYHAKFNQVSSTLT
jgi:nucleolar protein 56